MRARNSTGAAIALGRGAWTFSPAALLAAGLAFSLVSMDAATVVVDVGIAVESAVTAWPIVAIERVGEMGRC